jgi:pheromone shutdown protein TraB
VLVQTNPMWWEHARRLKYVDSQEEMNKYASELDKHSNGRYQDFYHSNRRWLGLFRFYFNMWLFQYHFRLDTDCNVFRPGLETKLACEAAEKVGAKLGFLGPELNQSTWQRVKHETRLSNMLEYITKCWQYRDTQYPNELESWIAKLRNVGPQAFTEKCLDSHGINWYIQATDVYFPKLKRIFVDERDQDLF